MHTARLGAAAVGLALLLAPTRAATAQGGDKSLLAPLVPGIRALVSRAQPRAEFASGKDIFISQYRTHNYTVRLRGGDGRRLPAFEQLGPRPGGFYLQLAVGAVPADFASRVQPPVDTRPWTIVTSVYPLSAEKEAVVMTWEAGPGAPPGLAQRVGAAVSKYVLTH